MDVGKSVHETVAAALLGVRGVAQTLFHCRVADAIKVSRHCGSLVPGQCLDTRAARGSPLHLCGSR